MLVVSDVFGEVVREVYELEWLGRDKLVQYLEVCGNRFCCLRSCIVFCFYKLFFICILFNMVVMYMYSMMFFGRKYFEFQEV